MPRCTPVLFGSTLLVVKDPAVGCSVRRPRGRHELERKMTPVSGPGGAWSDDDVRQPVCERLVIDAPAAKVQPSLLVGALDGESRLAHKLNGVREILVSELEITFRRRIDLEAPMQRPGDATKSGETHSKAHPRLGRSALRAQREVHGGGVQNRQKGQNPRKAR